MPFRSFVLDCSLAVSFIIGVRVHSLCYSESPHTTSACLCCFGPLVWDSSHWQYYVQCVCTVPFIIAAPLTDSGSDFISAPAHSVTCMYLDNFYVVLALCAQYYAHAPWTFLCNTSPQKIFDIRACVHSHVHVLWSSEGNFSHTWVYWTVTAWLILTGDGPSTHGEMFHNTASLAHRLIDSTEHKLDGLLYNSKQLWEVTPLPIVAQHHLEPLLWGRWLLFCAAVLCRSPTCSAMC